MDFTAPLVGKHCYILIQGNEILKRIKIIRWNNFLYTLQCEDTNNVLGTVIRPWGPVGVCGSHFGNQRIARQTLHQSFAWDYPCYPRKLEDNSRIDENSFFDILTIRSKGSIQIIKYSWSRNNTINLNASVSICFHCSFRNTCFDDNRFSYKLTKLKLNSLPH